MGYPQEANFAKILAISGANELLLVALQNEAGQRFHQAHRQGFQHNEYLPGLCDRLLADSQLQLQDLDALAVDLGPGSFTGQRISLSFAKGLSFALSKPLLGFSTFELWAYKFWQCYHCWEQTPFLVLIDGRKHRFYARLFGGPIQRKDTETIAEAPIGRQPIDSELTISTWDLNSRDLCQTIQQRYGSEFLARLQIGGPGAPIFSEELAELTRDANAFEAEFWSSWGNVPLFQPPSEADLAEGLLVLAGRKYQAQSYLRPSDGPLYLRKSDAEEQRELRQAVET